MRPPGSSTSSSEDMRITPTLRDTISTALWFILFLATFELLVWLTLTHTPLREGSLRNYFWYGESYEGKLRELARAPNPSPRSLVFAGWIDPETAKNEPIDADVTAYGSSFAGNVATAIKELRPGMALRFFGAPGAPLNHMYGVYELDRTLRKTRVAIIGIVSENVREVLTMNVGSVRHYMAMPYFYPRYDLVNGRIEKTGKSLINSRAEFVRSIDDPALWQRQLDILSAYDDGYRRFLFAADVFDSSTIARLIRRAFATRHLGDYLKGFHNREGYNRDVYAVQVYRALLVRMIDDLREEGVQPIVVLFATSGYNDHLHTLLADILSERRVPFVNTFDICPSTDRRSYVPDGHFTHQCDLKTARKTLDLIDAALTGTGR